MAVLLMKTRLMPDDELAEVAQLLDEHELAFYATTAGAWGISMPALWLVDATRLPEAKALLENYALQRQSQARDLYEALKESGRQRTFFDMLIENPARVISYLAVVAALVYFSITPFLHMG